MQLDRRRQQSATKSFGKGKEAAMLPAAPFPMTSFAMQGAAMIWDMQVQTARHLWRTQARAAAMLGFPDYSALFDAMESDAGDAFRATAVTARAPRQAKNEGVTDAQPHADDIAEQETPAVPSEARQVGDLVQEAERMQDIPQVIAQVIDAPAVDEADENVSAANADVQHEVVQEAAEDPAPKVRAARDQDSAPRREKHGKRGGRKASRK